MKEIDYLYIEKHAQAIEVNIMAHKFSFCVSTRSVEYYPAPTPILKYAMLPEIHPSMPYPLIHYLFFVLLLNPRLLALPHRQIQLRTLRRPLPRRRGPRSARLWYLQCLLLRRIFALIELPQQTRII